jgi:dihydrofolate reductase
MKIALIAAVSRNGVIGHANDLLWRLPEDLKRFRRTTLGHPVIMGRKTWDSIPEQFRPLPGRTNIVVTRQVGWQSEGAIVVHTLAQAIERARETSSDTPDVASNAASGATATVTDTAFVIGGAELYALALPSADELLLTEIARDFEGDARFPDWPRIDFIETSRETHHAAAPNDFDFDFVNYRRIPREN